MRKNCVTASCMSFSAHSDALIGVHGLVRMLANWGALSVKLVCISPLSWIKIVSTTRIGPSLLNVTPPRLSSSCTTVGVVICWNPRTSMWWLRTRLLFLSVQEFRHRRQSSAIALNLFIYPPFRHNYILFYLFCQEIIYTNYLEIQGLPF